MKLLKDITEDLKIVKSNSDFNFNINGCAIDSRKVQKDFVFIAYKGYAVDGHSFIESAIEKGAVCIVLDNKEYYELLPNVAYVLVEDAKSIVGELASWFYDKPTLQLTVVGVTGTNGKTSVSTLLFEMFQNLGYKAGLISTISCRYGDEIIPSSLTTPDPVTLQALFKHMVDEEVTHVFMEVSSHALDQGRVNGIDFDIAVFTNLTHDHLDYHGDFKSYIYAKKILFDRLKPSGLALVNIDDRNGKVMVQNTKASIKEYALKRPADYKAKIISNEISGLHLEIDNAEVFLQMVGGFNAYNALSVYGVCDSLDIERDEILRVLSGLKTAEGRLDIIRSEKVGYTSVVDYAHTPDALEKVLDTITKVKSRNGKLICVVGAGGDRDKTKRPKMARVAYDLSDIVLFTSDNPRSEDPEEIINDMLRGLDLFDEKRVIRISNRKEAIKMAAMLAGQDDVILIAGKGHEKYQEIKGQRFPFDDKKIISALMH